ncbi:large subunit ribosomal protein L24 [Mycoplasmoides fastidiosum]|uniref:Large ribosomal subunit protein uL24 n=1 Tax=Mycoplasmoides fastidiosum TaxID=92758 RepID=A0ABU0LY39_9BACT|nr:50S ribosomal protein L24 [Mycoplasmoides fastidiosum]MDQ0513623.1 large subunit ribosomal protein L24 [Mycoplasmoides fastidiosum]UUD37955.1 50S ribosomal protein L24 [Mycoplasmoides fastidiosum]
MQRIIKGDKVRVIAGKFKGTVGSVLAVYPKEQKVLVEGVNRVRRHTKPNQQTQDGGIVEKELPIHWSKVTLAHDKSKAVYTKVGYTWDKDNHKHRINRKTGLPIGKPK